MMDDGPVLVPEPFELPRLDAGTSRQGSNSNTAANLEIMSLVFGDDLVDVGSFNYCPPNGKAGRQDDADESSSDDELMSTTPSEHFEAIHEDSDDADGILLPPPPSEWTHRPLYIVPSKNTAVSGAGSGGSASAIHPSVPFQFDSELFVGTAIIRIVTGDKPDDADRRPIHRFQVAIQGRFKESLKLADVLTGQEFERPLKNLPPRWLVEAGSAAIRRLSPGVELDFHSDRSRMLANLAGTAKELRVEDPGSEPSVAASFVFEEHSGCFLVGGQQVDEDEITNTPVMRKRHLSDPDIASRLQYDTDKVYTFNFYQEMLDLETFTIDLGFAGAKLSIAEYLNGQPLKVLAKTRGGRYLWSFQIWHEDLLLSSGSGGQ